ncbi:signal peptidase I [Clostridium sp. HBUAS56010]|uniref:signal peptidase I n=1 Tax=Clostridium sp. HBUAS56010 TaxID=2571127 RepID=UPI001177441F|nr:signal peptidase I [Clostridium sp. HBUAS56010]
MDEIKNDQEKKPLNWKKELFEWIKIIVMASVIAFCINTFIIANSRVPSGSMETTIMTGDRVFGYRLAYTFGQDPKRGDIVIFDHATGPASKKIHLVKRIVGLPGETVDIRNNKIYINQSEKPLEEPYLSEYMETEDYHFEVPKGSYLMLGDNRNNSADARYWPDPYVPKNKILAKVLVRYYPGIKMIR